MVWCTKYNIYMQNIENGMTQKYLCTNTLNCTSVKYLSKCTVKLQSPNSCFQCLTLTIQCHQWSSGGGQSYFRGSRGSANPCTQRCVQKGAVMQSKCRAHSCKDKSPRKYFMNFKEETRSRGRNTGKKTERQTKYNSKLRNNICKQVKPIKTWQA